MNVNKGKAGKAPKGGTEKNNSAQTQKPKSEHSHNDREKISQKIAPTAEQLRIAQMIHNSNSTDMEVKEKITQVVQVAGVSNDDAIVALHDCNYDVSAAIDALLEGEDQGEWRESSKKKKKAPTKSKENKDDTEMNKENRRSDYRGERGSSKPRGAPPRFRGGRGRGGARDGGPKEDMGGRKSGRMMNGSGSYRGRGSRGRGSGGGFRTFQRQPMAFPETIDTWNSNTTPEKSSANTLQIDTWEDETSTNNDEWERDEWTGSLEQTTVFGPSTNSVSPPPVGGVDNQAPPGKPASQPGSLNSSGINDSVGMMMDQRSPKAYNSGVDKSSFSPNETMNFVNMLHKSAAPHNPMDSRMAANSTDSNINRANIDGSMGRNQNQGDLLSKIEDSMKATYSQNNSQSMASSQNYTPNSANSIFHNAGGLNTNLGNQINEKVVSISNQSTSLTRTKNTKRVQNSSKIPSSAVEMPEDAMAALDSQFSGLEFGTESFDFTSPPETKPVQISAAMEGPPAVTSMPQQPPASYSGNSSTAASNYSGQSSKPSSTNQTPNSFTPNYSGQTGTPNYQSNYPSSSSHPSLSSINVPNIKDASQPMQNYSESASVNTSLSGSLSTNNATTSTSSAVLSNLSSTSQTAKPSAVPGKTSQVGTSVPPGVQHLPSTPQVLHHQMNQPHHLQQQQMQSTQLIAGPASSYVSPPSIAGVPPAFFNVQQPAMYSYEDLQMFQQQRMPHLQQAPTSLPAGAARDGNLTSPAAYTVSEAGKFRSDQNTSPVPSTLNQQVQYTSPVPSTLNQQAPNPGTYITATGNAPGIPSYYMFHHNMAVPSSFPQAYGHPAIIQIPPNTHTGSTTTQFPGPPKLPYGSTSNYYDSMSQQSQEYKAGYASGSQGQSKAGSNTTGTGSNPGSDLSGYKNHFGKVSRYNEKQGFHSGTPPPFNMTGSGSNPLTANAYGPTMFFSTVPAAQHHSPLMHHQLHQNLQDGSSANSARQGAQNKSASKAGYSGSYWGSN